MRDIYHRTLEAMPAAAALQLQFFRRHGRLADLRAPRSFSEKIQARKLRPLDARYASLSDKVRVKDFVADLVGQDVVIPTIWHGTSLPEERPSDWRLPFVLKANHSSGWNIFVTDPSTDWSRVRQEAAVWLSRPWQPHLHETWYNSFPRQILAEPMIGDGEPPIDYKFFVFGGMVAFVQVDTARFTDHKRCFFDRDWAKQGFSLEYPLEPREVPRPKHFDQMIDIAQKLGAQFDFVRVDLYDLLEGPLFGEITFSPGSGYERFSPQEVDWAIGALWG